MITTSRLIIRSWTEADAGAFLELSQDRGFTLFPITSYRQETVEEARAWIKKTVHKWAVWEKASGALLGLGGLTPWTFEEENLIDITYRLRESAWGKGFGMELAEALVHYGFHELKLPEITATITPDNLASQKVAKKLGFIFDQKIILLGVPTELYRLRK